MSGETASVQVEESKPSNEGVTYMFPNKKVLIVEGFCILNYKPIADLCDYKYFITLSFGECLSRRVLRTYRPADVPGYFEHYVWPNYLIYTQQLESDSSVIYLDGTEPNHKEVVIDSLKQVGLVTMKGS